MITTAALQRLIDLGLTARPDVLRFDQYPHDDQAPTVWGHPLLEAPWQEPHPARPYERIDPLTAHPSVRVETANQEIGESAPNWDELERRLPELLRYRPGNLDEREPLEETELLAWYRPFHFEPQWKWGIYFREVGIYKVARALAPTVEPKAGWPTLNDLLNEAKQLLHLHETFHHVTEVAATALEFIDAESGARPPGRYIPYFYRDYEPMLFRGDPHTPLEEALANAYAYNRLKRNVKARARKFMRAQPGGYSDFERYLNENTRFRDGLVRLHGLLRGGGVSESPLETLFDMAPLPVVTQGVPTYLAREIVDPDFALGFRATFDLPHQVRDRKFEKDLKHRGDWERLVDRFQAKMEQGSTPGVDFERMCGSWYRAKLDDGLRVVLEMQGPTIYLRRALDHKRYERFRDALCN